MSGGSTSSAITRSRSRPTTSDIVTPNNDTPYSWAWLDLRAEPVVVSVPAVPKDRYYVMQWIDLFTQNFAYIGVRATGNEAGSYLIAGPKWQGEKPAGYQAVLKAETDIVGDADAHRAARAGRRRERQRASRRSTSCSRSAPSLGAPRRLRPRRSASRPTTRRKRGPMTSSAISTSFCNSPSRRIRARSRFASASRRSASVRAGHGMPRRSSRRFWRPSMPVLPTARRRSRPTAKTLSSNGLFGSRANLKTDYLKRDLGAMKGLYGNSLEEAWYGGYVGDGTKPSMIHFTKAESAAGGILLVDDALHAARSPALRQSDPPLLDRRPLQGSVSTARTVR